MKKGMIWILILALLLPAAAWSEENKAAALRERVDGLWDTWAGEWSRSFLDGEVLMPYQWKTLPFVTWADEAPTLKVTEENGQAEIRCGEKIGEDWRVCLGKGIPIVYTECTYDAEHGCWLATGEFEAVYLISDPSEERIGISIAYQRTDDFRPSHPVLEWSREDEDDVLAFNCYGWGTTRSFQGGMYAIASDQAVFYAEYDSEGCMIAWYDGMTGCKYDMYDQLVEGEEPADYICPVVH